METSFEFLKQHYGNHTRVAQELGITARQYRAIRNQGRKSEPILRLIRELVRNLDRENRAA